MIKELISLGNNGCYGCEACVNICPKQAIQLKENDRGHRYPNIDENRCIKCGICQRVCQIDNICKVNEKGSFEESYIAKHKNITIREKSRSGGVFVALAEYILSNDGTVYGTELLENEAIVSRITKIEEKMRFSGSKYVESYMQNSYIKICDDLRQGKLVLFSGTACQVGGVLQFLKVQNVSMEKLYTCDIVCHGAPKAKVFRDYIKFLSEKHKSSIEEFNFRDKMYGWDSHVETYVANGERVKSTNYTDMFYSHAFFKTSCYSCQYANVNRVTDFTLADAWGVKKNHAEFDDNRGVSLLLINTERAKQVFEKIKQEVEWCQVDLCDYMQPNMVAPTKIPKNYDKIWKVYLKKTMRKVIRLCNKEQNKIRIINRIKHVIVVSFKKIYTTLKRNNIWGNIKN